MGLLENRSRLTLTPVAAAVALLLVSAETGLAEQGPEALPPTPSIEPFAKGQAALLKDGRFDATIADYAARVLAPLAVGLNQNNECWGDPMRLAFCNLPAALKLDLEHRLVEMARDPRLHDEAQFVTNLYPLMIWQSGSLNEANDDVADAIKAFEFLVTQNGQPITDAQLLAAFKDNEGNAYGIGQARTIAGLYEIAVNAGYGQQFAQEWLAALNDLELYGKEAGQ